MEDHSDLKTMTQSKTPKETILPSLGTIRLPLSIPRFCGNEWKYVKECLDTAWVSSAGLFVKKFEDTLASYIGQKYAVACINGTSALHVALRVLGIKSHDEVLVPALTFVAPANAVRYVGAYPIFIDIQSDIWQIDPDKMKDFLIKECKKSPQGLVNRHTGRPVKAILPVHILGHPVDMEPILEMAQRFDLKVIEDATESLGAKYKGQQVGTFGDLACFSFNGNKIITTGQGGMIVTNNSVWAEKARYLTTQAKDDPVECIHNEIGYNYRLSNVQAAIGVAQMEFLSEFISYKRCIAERYRQGLESVEGISLPQQAEWALATFWLYTILVNENKFGMTSRDLLKSLCKEGIETRPLWHPLASLEPYADCYSYRIEVANKIYRCGLSLPSFVDLREDQQEWIIHLIKNSCKIIQG